MSERSRQINSGEYRHYCTVQTYTPTLDANNQELPQNNPLAWTNVFSFWGLVEPLSGRELVNAQQTIATVTHRITTRWQGTTNTFSPMQRITYQGINYNIGSVIDVDLRHQKIVILATQVATGPAQ